MVVLEKITAPASRNRAAGGASAAAGTSLVVAAPSGTGTPLVAMFSLIVAGTPSSGPDGWPLCQRSVDAFAVARAPSGSNAYSALMCGSHTAICASTSSSTSDGENCLARKAAMRSTAERSCSEVTFSWDTGLCMGACRKTGFDDAREHAGADGEDLVVQHIARVMHGHRTLMTEPEIGAGHDLQHIGEILAAHFGLRPREDFCGVDHGARHFLDHPGLLHLVDKHAEAVADVDRYLDLEGAGDAGADRAHPLADQHADLIRKRPDGAAQFGLAGDDIVGGAGVDLGDRQHRGLMRVYVATDDALQRLAERHGDDDGIFRIIRHRAMGAVTRDHDVEKVGAGHRRSRQDGNFAMVQ